LEGVLFALLPSDAACHKPSESSDWFDHPLNRFLNHKLAHRHYRFNYSLKVPVTSNCECEEKARPSCQFDWWAFKTSPRPDRLTSVGPWTQPASSSPARDRFTSLVLAILSIPQTNSGPATRLRAPSLANCGQKSSRSFARQHGSLNDFTLSGNRPPQRRQRHEPGTGHFTGPQVSMHPLSI